MNITRNKKLIIIGLVSASLIAGTALLVNKGAAFYTVQAGDAHTPSCIFNHYDKVDATYNKHGSKEFWACCNHPGKHLFTAPEVGTVVDKGPLDGLYFDELVLGDDRYIPSLYEDMDVLYDTKENYYVPQIYVPTYTPTINKLDVTYGNYVHYEIPSSQATNNPKENVLWFKPAPKTPIDAKQYSTIIFYFKSNQTIDNLQIRKEANYEIIVDSMKIEANTWTKIEVPVSEKTVNLDDIGFASWGERKNLEWNVTSMYGVKKEFVAEYTGELVFDASKYQYTPQEFSYVGLNVNNDKPNPSIGACCTVKFAESGQWIWFKPFTGDVSLAKYSSVYFYIKSNIDLPGFGVFNHEYTCVNTKFTLAANSWTKVEVEISELTPKLVDIAPGQWAESPRQNVELLIGSIYGILK